MECSKCFSENLARSEMYAQTNCEDPKDISYFSIIKMYACRDCGHIEMKSKKVVDSNE